MVGLFWHFILLSRKHEHSAGEGAEDDPELSVAELKKYNFGEKDITKGCETREHFGIGTTPSVTA